MTADIFDLPAHRPHTPETSVIGAAIDAAVGMGAVPDVASAVSAMTRVGEAFLPVPENRDLYAQLYADVYAKSYERLRPLYRDIQRITGYPRI